MSGSVGASLNRSRKSEYARPASRRRLTSSSGIRSALVRTITERVPFSRKVASSVRVRTAKPAKRSAATHSDPETATRGNTAELYTWQVPSLLVALCKCSELGAASEANCPENREKSRVATRGSCGEKEAAEGKRRRVINHGAMPGRTEPALVHAFRAISEAGDYAVVMLDADGRIVSWSSAAQRLLRRPASEAVGRRIAELLATDAAFERDLALAASGGQPDHEMVLTRGDGTSIVARVLLAGAGGSGGAGAADGGDATGDEVAGYVAVIRPAAASGERRAPSMVEKYAEAFAHADVVLRGVSEGVSVHDGNGRLLYVNDSAARFCGFTSAAEMLATPPAKIIEAFEMVDERGAPVDAARLPGRRVFTHPAETPPPLLVRVRSRATGVTWWSEIRASAIRDDAGRPELAINLWHDASAEQRKKEAGRVLGEAAARLSASIDYASTLAAVAQSLVPSMADWSSVELVEDGVRRTLAVAHVDPAKVAFARELVEKYPPDPNAPTGVPNVLRTGKAELYAEIPRDLLRAAAKDEEHWRIIEELGLRSGMVVPIVVEGRTEGALSLIAAESGRRYDEIDLELASEIGRRAGVAIAHARAYQAAQRAIRTRDEFLSVAGHELRTPLAALSLQIETIKLAFTSGRIDSDRPKYVARVDKAFEQVGRLARLVEDLLDVSRVSGGRLLLAPKEMDLAALTREVASRFVDVAARSACELTVEADAPVHGHWDPNRLDQVVSNLLANAFKYARGKPVSVACHARGDDAVLVVRDEGIGIAPEDHARIFERFERAVGEAQYAGLGLGLWIVREIVAGHGGDVKVSGAVGRGTEIAVTLPRAR